MAHFAHRKNIESNTKDQSHEERIPIDHPIPVEFLRIFDGAINSLPVRIVKDDGCNTKIVSTRLVKYNRQHFNLVRGNCVVQHSYNNLAETPNESFLLGYYRWVIIPIVYIG